MDALKRLRDTIYRFIDRYPPETVRRTGILLLVCILLLTSCISVAVCIHQNNEYTDARNDLGERIYTYLYRMVDRYHMSTGDPQDMLSNVLPDMEEWFTVAVELNSYLTATYGRRYTLLSSERIETVNAAFIAAEKSYATGLGLQETESSMDACINGIETLLMQRFKEDHTLRRGK